MPYDIVIEEANQSNGHLVLNPSGTLRVKRGHKVNWIIAASNVESYRIAKKERSPEVFSLLDKPPKKQTRKGSGIVGLYPRNNTIYEYSIFWIPKGEKDELEYDPKISIMPSIGGDVLIPFVVAVVSAIIGLLTFNFFNNRFRKN